MYVRFAIPAAAILAVLCATSGRLLHWPFWAYVGVLYFMGATVNSLVGRRNPELLAERLRPPSDRDRATRRLVTVPFLGHLVLAGLDARFGWSAAPLIAIIAGLVVLALALALVGWTLLTNPFASSAVRIQKDRAQRVIDTGPYAIVRHPMYTAVVLVCVAAGPALGSWYAGLAMLPVLPIFVRRTALEDGMLHRELEGYADYAQNVRWRLIPKIY